LVLTAKDVGPLRSDDTGPADLLDEAPEALFKALPRSDGHPTWRAFGAAYKSVGVLEGRFALSSER
jgi:hypothetical protein